MTQNDYRKIAAALRRSKPGRWDSLHSRTSFGMIEWEAVVTAIAFELQTESNFRRKTFLDLCEFTGEVEV